MCAWYYRYIVTSRVASLDFRRYELRGRTYYLRPTTPHRSRTKKQIR